eukprot:170379-Pelagomonas_calceolata.AAC.5
MLALNALLAGLLATASAGTRNGDLGGGGRTCNAKVMDTCDRQRVEWRAYGGRGGRCPEALLPYSGVPTVVSRSAQGHVSEQCFQVWWSAATADVKLSLAWNTNSSELAIRPPKDMHKQRP